MDRTTKIRYKKYDRVMSRVFNRSRSSLNSSSFVTRHDLPSSVRDGGKQSFSNISSGVFSDLPKVLHDFNPEIEKKTSKRTSVVKPRKTIQSLDPAVSPPRLVLKARENVNNTRKLRAPESTPSLVNRDREKWSDSHVRQCYSSRSHSKLKDLQKEIHEYQQKEKMMRLRSQLYKSCGVVLDDVGQVAEDKGVQAYQESDVHIGTDR